jgi:peptidyl-prolyl cis-trans isomerase C
MIRLRVASAIRPWAAVALMMACSAATVLPAVAAVARTKTKATRSAGAADSNQVLVQVGKEAITRGDVQRRIASLPEQFRANYVTPDGRQQLLDRMIEEKVWMAMAVKNGVPAREQVRQQLEQQRRDVIIRTYLNEVMAANPAVSDSDAHLFYEANIADYRVPATVTLRHIQFKKESDAKRVLPSAKQANAKWDDLVKRWSTDSLTRASGGSLGTVTREGQFASIGPQPALAEEAMKLEAGQVAGPFKTDRGWHILKVESVKTESTRPFEQVKQVIERQLNSQRTQDYYKSQLEGARRSLGVKPDSAAIRGFVSQKKTAREQFNEAQALSSPQARIEAYAQLLRDYPISEVSPQAQFMIGFINSEELKDHDAAEKAFRELLQRWPKAELAASAQWMIEHMRSEEAPAFINLDSDSAVAVPKAGNAARPVRGGASKSKGSAGKGTSSTP